MHTKVVLGRLRKGIYIESLLRKCPWVFPPSATNAGSIRTAEPDVKSCQALLPVEHCCNRAVSGNVKHRTVGVIFLMIISNETVKAKVTHGLG